MTLLALGFSLFSAFTFALAPARAAEPAAESPAAVTDSDPGVTTIMQRMKSALEPTGTGTREVDIILSDPDGITTHWRALEAQDNQPNGGRLAMVMLEPDSISGAALLIQEQAEGPDFQWQYLPAVRRVRKIYPVGGFQPFLGTDFTFSDLGFVKLENRSFSLLGKEKVNGVNTYKVEEIPLDRWYYGRVESWVAADTFLPLRRDYYTPAGELWKRETFTGIEKIDGVPTPTRVRMEDLRGGGSTELRYSNIRYGAKVPPSVFQPDELPQLASHLQSGQPEAPTPGR